MGVCSELIPEEEAQRQEENADEASDEDFADEARCVPRAWVKCPELGRSERPGDSELVMSRIILSVSDNFWWIQNS